MKHFILSAAAALSITAFGQTIIINEDFESGIPSSWTVINKDGLTPDASVSEYTEAWIGTTDPFDTSSTPNHCASATSFFTTTGNANRWLITPAITLAGFGNILEFKAASFDPSFPDNYMIKIGTDVNNPDGFTTLVTYLAEAPHWSTHSLNFDTLGYNNQTIHIAFVLISDNGHKLFLDDISFRVEDPVSTKETAAGVSVNIYPNPTADILNISVNGENVKKEIYNLAGQKLIQTTENAVNVQHLKPGIYLLKVENSDRLIKFIKE